MILDLWYKNAVIYNLDLETFLDADGDGVGDFEGLVRRLDYIHSLGCEVIWLAPFQTTPNKDNGYDIADYYTIDQRHGTAGDFVFFMHEAKKRGIKVIIDLVINHTSDQHPWFQAARADKESPYRDWYLWADERPSDADELVIFPGVQQSTWTYDRKAQAYYFHRFYKFQPDLNIANPEVRTEIQRIIGYWLQLGVDGFRIDAVPFYIETFAEDEEGPTFHFEYLHELRDFIQWRSGDAIMLGEANIAPSDSVKYFGDKDEALHMMFNFYVNQHLFYALATGEAAPLIKAIKETKNIPRDAQWAHFLRNHDELDLGRLTEEQRQKVFERFGPEEDMQIYNRGIRRRLAPMLGGRQRLELAYSVIFSLPGTPVIRYGQEIGMGDDLSLPERQAVRTPMQWSDHYQAGFSTAEELIHPVIDEGPYRYERVNVEKQQQDPDSLLNWFIKLIHLRKSCEEIGWGEWEILEVDSESVLAIRYQWRQNTLIALHNFAEQPQEFVLDLETPNGEEERLVSVFVDEKIEADEEGRYQINLKPYGYCWYRLGSLNYVLNQEKA